MKIVPESKSLEKILSGLETRYCVPDYQRDYSWSPSEVETLWLDIITSYKQGSEYFMGTIVLKKDDESSDAFDIVDGQQRLATFSILFSVISCLGDAFSNNPDIFKKTPRDKKNNDLARKISSISRARLREPSEPDNYFLKLNKKDNQLFADLITLENYDSYCINESELKVNKSDKRLIKTRKTFTQSILESFNDENALQELSNVLVHIVKKLKFITIEVETDYDAFLLFESLNSKGMDLSVSDLVKNKILMKANGDEDKNDMLLYDWDEMIALLEDSRLSPVDFLRVYWEAIQGQNITKKELYKNVGRHIDDPNTDIFKFSKELKKYASELSIYASSDLTFPKCMHNKEKYLAYCGEINTLKYTTCYPVIMYVKGKRPELLEDVTRLSLSFLFRWITIGDYSIGGAKKIFDLVLSRLRNENSSREDVLSPFLMEQDKIGDEAFISALKQFRAQDNHIAKYILSKCYLNDNFNQSVPNYIEIHLEHILPQSFTLWEKDDLFELPKGTHIKDYVYNLGNMTLLHKPINQKIKNGIFSLKAKEYNDSIFIQTKKINKRYNEGYYWNAEWIAERADEIAKQAPTIWPLSF
ncbi:DUF262 domain-containing protein [Cronobacter dublinensis]|uniref:DUF262 domain-containing protein n=1 Tax=Cronobacter dublinensis TaxID=413497 RepID=UPI001319BAE2|nr:DUF262 domain-containing protein [Cronobacter dublinensis]MDI7505592.1 DUF262 domain-containing HNH endonuclease family protein [Cronobacter dublinensis]